MGDKRALPDAWVSQSRNSCANCRLRENCMPAGLTPSETAQFAHLILPRYRVPRGGHLCRAGDELVSLFAVLSGSLKSSVSDKDGRTQIMGFNLAGDLLGTDAIDGNTYLCDVVALEDSEVCKIPYAGLQRLSLDIAALGINLNRAMSVEIGRGYGVMMLLGRMHAEERLAAFLLDISQRLLARGYSPSQFLLRMTREEIGSYLGMKLETVSRMFSRFQRDGIVEVHGKDVRLVDHEKLTAVVQGVYPHLGIPVSAGGVLPATLLGTVQ